MTESEGQSEPPPTWLVPGDYEHAMLHLAWLVASGVRYLVFAQVVLYPAEFPEPDETAELVGPTFKVGAQLCRTYLKRQRLSLEEALRWYDASLRGWVQLWGATNKRDGSDVFFSLGDLAQEPQWPTVCTGSGLPFVDLTWGVVRSHHLVQPINPEHVAALTTCEHSRSRTMCEHIDAREWFSEHLYWDLAVYPEWIGSINLVAPNPLYRDLQWRLERPTNANPERVVSAIARANCNLDGLRLHVEEFGPIGVIATHDRTGMGAPERIRHTSPESILSFLVTCPQRGVLDCSEPRSVTSGPMGIHLVSGPRIATQRIAIPGTARKPGVTRVLPLIQTTLDADIGPPPDAGLAASLLWNAVRRAYVRGLRVEKWFYRDQKRAEKFIQGLIANAVRRVWIIDPYFGVVGLFRFALGTTRTDVETHLLVGVTRLKEDDPTEPSSEAGEILLREVRHYASTKPVEARVMIGTPAVHDRFLVIDDAVFLSGSSLHSLGERASMVVQILDGEPIVRELAEIMHDADRTTSLEAWVEQRSRTRSCRIPPFLRRALRKLLALLERARTVGRART